MNSKWLAYALVAPILFCLSSGQEWSFDLETGPGYWEDLGYDQCGPTNLYQTPIDLITSRAVGDCSQEIDVHHNRSAFTVSQSHGAPVFSCKTAGSCGGIKFGEDEYDLVQFHLHGTSENAINGVYGSLEVHFVHARTRDDGEIAYLVFGRIYRTSEYDNHGFAPFFNAGSIAADGNTAEFYIDPFSDMYGDAMQSGHKLYIFQGSFTTPPCSGGVQWLLLEKFGTVSEAQAAYYVNFVARTAQNGNNRPIQPVNGRPIAYITF
mmetsp:Transcript_44434/g.109078  ORF Transcript_44434/g.109078 Transcript_44434/m.109078 type:complete len:264 (+) Transcript_44434:160-951(+)